MKQPIENIVFSRFVKQSIPFELISLRELYRRCDASSYDLSIPHRIAFHALIIVTNAKSKHMVDFKEYDLFPGVVLPLTKGQVHAFHKNLEIEGIVISFEERFISQNISEKDLFHFLHLYHTPHIVIGEENLKAIDAMIQLLRGVHEDKNTHLKSDLIRAIFISLLLQITRFSTKQHQILESQRFKDFIRFKSLVSQHYTQNHKAGYYAKKMGISYKYLNDVCKEVTSKTARVFIDEWLLLEIKRNVIENRYSSKEISFKMGFNEPSNFIRFFKRHTGTTPRKFQQTLQ